MVLSALPFGLPVHTDTLAFAFKAHKRFLYVAFFVETTQLKKNGDFFLKLAILRQKSRILYKLFPAVVKNRGPQVFCQCQKTVIPKGLTSWMKFVRIRGGQLLWLNIAHLVLWTDNKAPYKPRLYYAL